MKPDLKADLERLARLGYGRGDWGQELVKQFHRLPQAAKRHPDFPLLTQLYPWLFVPLTLWPAELEGLGRHVLATIKSGKRLDARIKLLLSLLGQPPN
jgi:hypothetical protein